jgi:hypothetical protein
MANGGMTAPVAIRVVDRQSEVRSGVSMVIANHRLAIRKEIPSVKSRLGDEVELPLILNMRLQLAAASHPNLIPK